MSNSIPITIKKIKWIQIIFLLKMVRSITVGDVFINPRFIETVLYPVH